MLARTPRTLVYLSADELGITERERAGLIEVRDDLASGSIKHARPTERLSLSTQARSEANLFNMWFWASKTDCGTAFCIAGHMLCRGALNDYHSFSETMRPLFAPFVTRRNATDLWLDLTTAQAVRAIDHFLSGAGSDCWTLALADEPA